MTDLGAGGLLASLAAGRPQPRAVIAAFLFGLAGLMPAIALELQGHRGARGLWPENSLSAFAGALRIGVDALELDLAMTSDGVLVVSHDPRLNADHTRGPHGAWIDAPGPVIHALRWSELAGYDIGWLRPGSRAAERFPEQRRVDGERLARLEEVFALVERASADHVRFNIEIKLRPDGGAIYPALEPFATAVVAAIRAAKLESRAVVQGFDWSAIRAVKRLAPEIRVAALTAEQQWLDNVQRGTPGASPWTDGLDIDEHASLPALVNAAGAEIWSPYWREVDARLVHQAHALGLEVVVWTVNEPAAMRALIAMGVDGIITDYPDRLVETVRELRLRVPPVVDARWPAK